MAKKHMDIMPPYVPEKRQYHRESPKKKEKRKSRSLFIGVVFILFLSLILYILIRAEKQSESKTNTPSSSTDSSQFELFNATGDSNFTQNLQDIKVKILNGSSATTNAAKVNNLLEKNGYDVRGLTVAANDYTQSIIYYKKNDKSLAEKLSQSIKSVVSPILQESENLDVGYDILIIVGLK